MMSLADEVAEKVAEILRLESCPHGLPYDVPCPAFRNPNGTVRPLCDACVMAAVREVFQDGLTTRERTDLDLA